MKHLLIAALLLTALPATAQEVTLGIGYSDFGSSLSTDTVGVDIGYYHAPFHETGRWEFGWGAVLGADFEEDSFIGAGIVANYDLDGPWFLRASLMPGAYFEGNPFNDLGSKLEFRSSVALGYDLKNGNAVSVSVRHLSNASTGDTNPGVNGIGLHYHFRF